MATSTVAQHRRQARRAQPPPPPQGKWSNIIYGTTSNLGDRPARPKERPSYLDGWLCPARPKVPSIAAHRRGPPRRGLQLCVSGPASLGTCMSSKAGGYMLSDGQAMMRFSPVWEADYPGVPSPG
jgi:hypothetical protein